MHVVLSCMSGASRKFKIVQSYAIQIQRKRHALCVCVCVRCAVAIWRYCCIKYFKSRPLICKEICACACNKCLVLKRWGLLVFCFLFGSSLCGVPCVQMSLMFVLYRSLCLRLRIQIHIRRHIKGSVAEMLRRTCRNAFMDWSGINNVRNVLKRASKQF